MEEVIIGIDLGTTNSEVAVIRSGVPVVLTDNGDPILPSVVGLDLEGKLVVGRAARNQFVLAPERTVRSIKRKMGKDERVQLGSESFSPQEISAMILRALKQRAENALGHSVSKAVITVPAFFNDGQREATRQAGELAGLDVVRIINEPTAAVLTYDSNPPEMERLLVYDLGGGTFDVSIAQVEQGVVEILSSHGDTNLGGDDFDLKLLNFVCDKFQTKHSIDLRDSVMAKSRLLTAVEEAKKSLSFQPFVNISEEFIATKNGVPLNLEMEISRDQYEALIEPLLAKTLKCVDDALNDAKLLASDISKVLLVGGATRTPMVRNMLTARMQRPVHAEIEPDLAVAMGAAVQGGIIAGADVGPVLVDITPHSLGIKVLCDRDGLPDQLAFSPIIPRNSPLPIRRSEVYCTHFYAQTVVNIEIYQGEDEDVRFNTAVGAFEVRGLAEVPPPNAIVVDFQLDLNGILRVTATERATGLAKHVVIDNWAERFRQREQAGAQERIDSYFAASETTVAGNNAEESERITRTTVGASAEIKVGATSDLEMEDALDVANALVLKSNGLQEIVSPEDKSELEGLLAELRAAMDRRSLEDIRRYTMEIEEMVFYMSDR